ncbi:hypothetical protein ACFLXY_08590 [Chloroflexota bacterium]
MNQRKINNQDAERKRFKLIMANSSMGRLKEMKVTLCLIQTACTFALEGNNRVTASEISNRANIEYDLDTTASFTGQVFSKLGIQSVTVHGKNRFVLDSGQLEKLRQSISSQIEEMATKLESALKEFNYLPKRLNELESQLKDIRQQNQRGRELQLQINEEEKNLPDIIRLENILRIIREKAKQAIELEKEIKALNRKIKKMPSLDEKKKVLKETISKYENSEKNLADREQEYTRNAESIKAKEDELNGRIEKLQSRIGWLELAELQEAIKTAKEELDQILRRLGEKRTLLDKVLMRNRQRE